MDFFKQHWRKIVFGLVVASSIGLGTMGLMAGDRIRQDMALADQITTKLKTYGSGGANLQMIREKKEATSKAKSHIEEAIKVGRDLQVNDPFHETVAADGTVKHVARKPVLDGALPKLARGEVAFNFKDAYIREHAKMVERLHAKGPPTPDDYQAMVMQQRSRAAAQRDQAEEAWSLIDAATGSSSAGNGPGANVTRADLLRQSPDALASLERAKSIYMYLDQDALALHPLVRQDEPPSIEQIWQAQMALWIQHDLVSVLARLNEGAIADMTREGHPENAWVAYLPIKRLVRFSIQGRLGRGGSMNAQNCTFANSFTGRKNSSVYFVVPLQVQLVLDARVVPKLLAELTRTNFYTPTLINYERIPPDLAQRGYVYGSEPIILLTLDYEGYFFRDVFNQWMPETIKPILDNADAREPLNERGRG